MIYKIIITAVTKSWVVLILSLFVIILFPIIFFNWGDKIQLLKKKLLTVNLSIVFLPGLILIFILFFDNIENFFQIWESYLLYSLLLRPFSLK